MSIVERLEFGEDSEYSSVELSIHLGRYLLAKQYCQGKKVLDIACGEGYGSYVMAENWGAEQVHGVDVSQTAIDKARSNFQSENLFFDTLNAEGEVEHFAEGYFDVVVSFETIEHLNNPTQFLHNIRKWVKKDGIIIISCPNDYWYYKEEGQGNPFHLKKYTFQEFITLSETILGSANKFLYGLPVSGFANFEADHDAIEKHMKSNAETIGKFVDGLDTIMIPTTYDINSSNVSYFVGVWGGSSTTVKNTATFYSTSMEELRVVAYDSYVELGKKIEENNSAYNEHVKYIGNLNDRIAELDSHIVDLNINLDTIQKDKGRLELILEAANKENSVLKKNFWQSAVTIKTVERVVRDDSRIKALEAELDSLMHSKSWKITSPLRRVFNFFRGK
ncbi:putative S-adenosylmethionine-dependent methyltransferase [compost metagenome]